MMAITKILDNKKWDLSCKSNDRDDSNRPTKFSLDGIAEVECENTNDLVLEI